MTYDIIVSVYAFMLLMLILLCLFVFVGMGFGALPEAYSEEDFEGLRAC
jgi:hypothetical protein